MDAVGYIRVSTDEQYIGPEAQRRAIYEYARSMNLNVVEVFSDIGVGGDVDPLERPGFSQMIKYASGRGVRHIVVYALDRLGRDLLSVLRLLRHLSEQGFVILSVREPLVGLKDPTASSIIIPVMLSIAQYERFLIRERTRNALRARGVKHSLNPPAHVKGMAIEMYRGGLGIKAISRALGISERQVRKILYEAGILTPGPNTCPRCFHRLIWDPIYNAPYCPNCGYVKQG